MNVENLTDTISLYNGDCLEALRSMPDRSVNCCVTSPPYFGLRTYLPDHVKIRSDISGDELIALMRKLESLGISPAKLLPTDGQ
jgi:DNA modification methylase